ncbi:hypothetical protein KXD96_28100 (plasmid) [Mycobacterium sp. SMC-2]|uniref:hypothetical protein n=1 Tax=Mycobacterium sp. SMC-2 TaxID=2857058 RepID=UPI0021B2FCD3|nr:hypothetical protein [Mycobacterium sp. SMC-2]UXA06599.1 hypothetical protein KXD96_27950 [Mycobacterium sp. SMC-2]UXA09693.1 hypothetical protein KXD96_28100 [Mycobacterium sp. SMC-2]
MRRLLNRINKWLTRLLELFNRWFCSAPGVWHTLLAASLMVLIELVVDPGLDPHGFWLLYVLTIYSAVTQPALAYVAAKSAKRTDAILAELRKIQSDEFVLDTKTYDLVAHIANRSVE